MTQLTKKNQEFLHIASHQLEQDGKSQAEIKAIIDDITPTILEEQAKGIPARSFLGAPTVWAASFSQNPNEEKQAAPKNTDPKLMWADSALFFLGVIALIQGVLTLTNKNQEAYGLLTLLATGLAGGGVMYLTYHFFYRHIGKNKSERPSFWKNIGMLVLAYGALLLLISLTALIPAGLNPSLPPLVLLLIAGLAFLGRYWMKKTYNIQSAFTTERR